MATLPGAAFDDFAAGTPSMDFIFGAAGNDLIDGGDGDDYLFGDDGDDLLLGDHGEDVLVGGAGDDRLVGGADDDVLYGGTGNDIMHGGAGDDVFMFAGGGGQDVILDFTAGSDLLQIVSNVNDTGIEAPEDLVGRVHDTEFGATIDLGNGDSVTLANVGADEVEADPSAYVSIV